MGDYLKLDLAGDAVEVSVRRNSRAKRLILRVDKTSGDIKLTLPPYVNSKAAQKFIHDQTDWLIKERAALQPVATLSHSDVLPFLGEELKLHFTDAPPRSVHLKEDSIIVGGPSDLAATRLEKWLRQEAKRILSERASYHADTLGTSYSRISIGDMKSRWGSCSSSGTLRFSWRLIMAPFDVLDYVAAHEVAHLLEMNHSDRFWNHVERCIPDFHNRRKWLKTEGNSLFKICFNQVC